MLANNNNQLDALIQFLISKFEELPDKIDNQEFISKFDALIGIQIDANASKKLKQFIEFCYKKMQGLKYSKDEVNYFEKYSSDFIAKINSLEEKFNTISQAVEDLDKEKQDNSLALELNKSNNKKLEEKINKLEKEILGLNDENIDLKNEREKQKIKINEIEVQISGLNGKNIEFENKNKDLEKNIQKLQTEILGLKDENIDLKNEREKQKIKIKELEDNCQTLNKNIIDIKKESKNEIKSLKSYVDNYVHQIYGLNQELLGVKDEKRDIIERDNYSALI